MAAAHIGIVLHDFSSGGSERIAIRLGNAWAASGRRVTLFCGSEDGVLRALVGPMVAVVCVRPETRRSAISRLLLAIRLNRVLASAKVDVLFAPGNYHLLVCALLGRMNRHLPLVCKLSNPVRPNRAMSKLERMFERGVALAAAPIDTLIAMSAMLHDEARLAFPGAVIETIAEPVLNDDFAANTIRGPAKSKTILCAGRLAAQKDFGLALAAFAQLDPALGFELKLLGTGPLKAELLAKAEQLGIASRVDFAGYVPDIASNLKQSRLFLMTSQFEGYPAVLIEALAAGVPVVTTKCSPAIAEVIPARNFGEIVDSRDPAEIAKAILRVASLDPPGGDTLVQHLEKHAMSSVALQYLAVFDRLKRSA